MLYNVSQPLVPIACPPYFAMKIYTSPYAPVPVANESIYTHLAVTRFGEFPPEHPAYIDAVTGKTITRGEWRELTLSMAWGLRHELHKLGGPMLQRGDVAMIFSPNSIAWPIMLFGGVAAGLRMTLANSAYTPRELKHQWIDSGAKVLFVHPTLVPVVLEMFKDLDFDLTSARRRIIVADWPIEDPAMIDYIRMKDLLDKGRLEEEEKFPRELSHETNLLCYSSGTTGKPKGVMVNTIDPTTSSQSH
jgi:4-coumarate--CoA ligase